jgi:hypothetical protein
MKPSKHFEIGERREEEMGTQGGGERVQGTRHACMEFSQWNSGILLMYVNTKIKFYERI